MIFMLNFPINEIICFRLYYYYTGNLFQNHWINQIYLVIKKALVFFARAFFIYAINSIYIMTSNCNLLKSFIPIIICFFFRKFPNFSIGKFFIFTRSK